MSAPASAPTGVLRHLQLHVKILDSGALVVSTPQARERADTVRGPEQLWSAVQMAMVRARMAGHAQWCQPAPQEQVPRLREGVSWSKHAAARPDVTDTAAWTPLPDGSWLSPGGKRYRSMRLIAGIVARRERLGLPTSYEAEVAAAVERDQAGQQVGGVSEVDRLFDRIAAATPDTRWHEKDRRNPARAAA